MSKSHQSDLRALRKELGLTQAQLASVLGGGCTRQTICEQERGCAPISPERMMAVLYLVEIVEAAQFDARYTDDPDPSAREVLITEGLIRRPSESNRGQDDRQAPDRPSPHPYRLGRHGRA